MHRKFPLIGVLGVMVFSWFSCTHGGKKQEKQAVVDSLQDTVANNEVKQWFNLPGLQQWTRTIREKTPSFSADSFSAGRIESIQAISSGQFSNRDWKTYLPYLVFSPDSSRAIDLFSYGTIPQKNKDGSTTLQNAEADSEVSLVDVPTRKRQRILFAGPGTSFQDAAWWGDSVLIVTGISDANTQNEPLPVIWKINLLDSSLITYGYVPGDSAIFMQP